MPYRVSIREVVFPLLLAVLAGCAGDSPTDPAYGQFQLILVSGDWQTGLAGRSLEEPLVVKLIDEKGAPVADREIAWTVGTGSTTPATSRTDADGIATTRWTLGDQERQSARAKAIGLDAATVYFVAEVGKIWNVVIEVESFLVEGEERTLPVKAYGSNGRGTIGGLEQTDFEWSSSNPAVATVDSAGRVRAIRAGTAAIHAEAQGVRGGAGISVVLEDFRPRQFSTSRWISCGVVHDGSAYCFGVAYSGAFGYEPTQYEWPDYATPAYPGHRFAEIVTGELFTCGRSDDGQVYCSGESRLGRSVQDRERHRPLLPCQWPGITGSPGSIPAQTTSAGWSPMVPPIAGARIPTVSSEMAPIPSATFPQRSEETCSSVTWMWETERHAA